MPWEISVFEPTDFSTFGFGDFGSVSNDWITGTDGVAPNVNGVEWPEGPSSSGEGSALSLSDVLQNDAFDQLLDPSILIGTSAPSTTLPTGPLSLTADPLLFPLNPPSLSVSPQETSLSYHEPSQSQSQSRSRSQSGSPPKVNAALALKRQRNNVAARKYRQKKIDRINELELELRGVMKERDDLRIRLARQEAESAALRSLLKMKTGSETGDQQKS